MNLILNVILSENSFEENEEQIRKETTDIFEDFNEMIYNFACLISQNQVIFMNINYDKPFII